jgi:hypothetical protein
LLLRAGDYRLVEKLSRRKIMAKDVINVGGEEKVVREDTAKSYRGTVWALISVLGFLIIGAILFLLFFSGSLTDDKPNQSPGKIEEKRN